MIGFLLLSLLLYSLYGKADPPKAEEIPHTVEKFGVELSDPFFYFSDSSQFEKVKKYIDEENDWADTNVYEDKLVEILKDELEKYESSSHDTNEYVTEFPNANLEYYKFEPLTGYGKWMRRNMETKEDEEVVLDETELFEMLGKPDFFSVARIAPSPDHKTIAFLYDTLGDERHTIGFRDLTTKTFLEETLEDSYYGIVWSEDSTRILYEQLKNLPNQPLAVSSYEIGTTEVESVEVFTAKDESVEVTLELSSDQEVVVITEDSFHGIRCMYLFLNEYDVTNISEKIQEFPIPYTVDLEYYIDHSPSGFIVRKQNFPDSNFGVYIYKKNDEEDFSIFTVREEQERYIVTRIDCFHEVFYVWGYNTNTTFPFVEAYTYNNINVSKSLIFQEYTVLEFHTLSTQDEKYAIEPYYDDWFPVLGGSCGYYESKLKFTYSSLITPPRTYEFDLFNNNDDESKELEHPKFTLLESVIVENFDSTQYVDDVIFIPNNEGGGPDIPVHLCWKKNEYSTTTTEEEDNNINNLKNRPVWVYTYGAYGSIIDPRFREHMLPILERGFVFAIAHVRGSSIRGMKYYHEGYRQNKKNTWDDLNIVLKYFHDSGIVQKNSNQVVIEGASAGGLTVARATISRPDLMNVTIATVPFVDVLNTMMDDELPYTIMERTQWGDPENNRDDFTYMHSYDPYFSLSEEEKYPNMYLRAGINDQRVKFWEPLKFMAKMRSWRTSSSEKETTMNTEQVIRVYAGGHFGASEGGEAREAVAKVQAFVIQKIMGWNDTTDHDHDTPEEDVGFPMSQLLMVITLALMIFGCWLCCICVYCIGFGSCFVCFICWRKSKGSLSLNDCLNGFFNQFTSKTPVKDYDPFFEEIEGDEEIGDGDGDVLLEEI